MKQLRELTFRSSNGLTDIHGYIYDPDVPVNGTVQIAHGIAEHCERYDAFARFLCENGFAVYCYDHVGHGRSVDSPEHLGWFAGKNGWEYAVEDMHAVFSISCSEYPNASHVLFGHSMGSFLSRTYLYTYPQDFNCAVICGTAHMAKPVVYAGKLLAEVLCLFGPEKRSSFLNSVAFGSYNKNFTPARTDFDWLTRDTAVVDAYVADPLCGYVGTSRLYADMMGGLIEMEKTSNIGKMNKDCPVFFIAGSMDPVGENGKGVLKAEAAFRAAGMKNVTCKLYEDCRHELLNELNKKIVFRDILDWITNNK